MLHCLPQLPAVSSVSAVPAVSSVSAVSAVSSVERNSLECESITSYDLGYPAGGQGRPGAIASMAQACMMHSNWCTEDNVYQLKHQ